MKEIYAASLSMSQGGRGVVVTASLLHSDEERTIEFHCEWPEIPAINANANATEWLYSALSRMLQDYDVHTVTRARTVPAGEMKAVRQREA